MIAAFHLTFRQYLSKGFIQQKSIPLLYSLVDLLPTTVNFIGSSHGRVIGTVTTVIARNINVPSTDLYPKEIRALASNSDRVYSEGTKFAIEEGRSAKETSEFVRSLFFWWKSFGVTDVLAVVHPRHTAFWKRSLRFKALGATKPCKRVSGSPGALLHLDVENREDLETGSRRSQKFRTAPCSSFPQPYRLTSTEVMALILAQPSILSEAKQEELNTLLGEYPQLTRCVNRSALKVRLHYLSTDFLRITHFEASAYIKALLRICERVAEEKGVCISISSPKELPALVGDYERFAELLSHILLTLCSNAKTGETISVSHFERNDSSGEHQTCFRIEKTSISPLPLDWRDTTLSGFRAVARSIFGSEVMGNSLDSSSSDEKKGDIHLIDILGKAIAFEANSTIEFSLPSYKKEVNKAANAITGNQGIRRIPKFSKRALLIGGTFIEAELMRRWLESIEIRLIHRDTELPLSSLETDFNDYKFIIIEGRTPSSHNFSLLEGLTTPSIGVVSSWTTDWANRSNAKRPITLLRKPLSKKSFLIAANRCLAHNPPRIQTQQLENLANLG
jgi:hypothetical protein